MLSYLGKDSNIELALLFTTNARATTSDITTWTSFQYRALKFHLDNLDFRHYIILIHG